MSLTPAEFQQKLIDHGFSCGTYGADGYWGPATEGAVEGWFDTGMDLDGEPPPPPEGQLIPDDWMPECAMTYITVHWSAGAYEVSSSDKEHYHFIVDGGGRVVRGDYSIKANVSTGDNDGYAAHTNQANTKNIGIAAACMAGATESPFNAGKYPLTELQWMTLAKIAAELAVRYGIPCDRTKILSHGEWQSTNGVPQSGKWDINKLPWSSGLSKSEVNDQFRQHVKNFM
jgi:hypothetical protein